MNLRRTIAVLSTVATVAIIGIAGVAVAQSFEPPADQANPIIIRGCVIRYDTTDAVGHTAPRFHANSVHYCVGFDTVAAQFTSGATKVTTSLPEPNGNSEAVVAITVEEDETFAERGIQCGPSGATRTFYIYCWDRDGELVKAHSSEILGPAANLWVTVISWEIES